MAMARRLAREEGMLLGGSAGLNVHLALEIARELDDADACVVTILCDTGERYLSKVFNDEWMEENQLLDKAPVTVEQLLANRPHGAPEIVQVAPAAAVRQALNLMSTWGVSQIPVIDDGNNVGGLIEGTLMTRVLAQPSLLDRPVREVMDAPFPEVEASTPADRLAQTLTRESPAALVRRNGKLAGIVSRYALLHRMIGTRCTRRARSPGARQPSHCAPLSCPAAPHRSVTSPSRRRRRWSRRCGRAVMRCRSSILRAGSCSRRTSLPCSEPRLERRRPRSSTCAHSSGGSSSRACREFRWCATPRCFSSRYMAVRARTAPSRRCSRWSGSRIPEADASGAQWPWTRTFRSGSSWKPAYRLPSGSWRRWTRRPSPSGSGGRSW